MKLSPILLAGILSLLMMEVFEMYVIHHQNTTIQSQRALIRLQYRDSNALVKCQGELSRQHAQK